MNPRDDHQDETLSSWRSSAIARLRSWANNRYPGAACDIPTAFYSLSFAQQYWSEFADVSSSSDACVDHLLHIHPIEHVG